MPVTADTLLAALERRGGTAEEVSRPIPSVLGHSTSSVKGQALCCASLLVSSFPTLELSMGNTWPGKALSAVRFCGCRLEHFLLHF